MNIQHGLLADQQYREGQEQALEFIANSDKRFLAINAPTGSGKSIIGFDGLEAPFFYLCSSIHLEHQLLEDFPEARVLKGKGNYPCHIFESPDLCVLKKKCFDCPYEQAKKEALASDYTILNYHYFLYATNYTEFGSKVRNIICDEADQLESILTEFISFNFMFKSLDRLNLLKSRPSKKTKIEAFIPWIDELFEVSHRELRLLEPELDAMSDKRYYTKEDNDFLRRCRRIENVHSKAGFLRSQELSDENWIYYSSDEFVQCKPLWLTRDLADRFLFDKGKRFLFMSATLPAKSILCNLYGIDPEEMDYEELPHPFPVENRPIIYKPAFSLTNKSEVDDEVIRKSVMDILESESDKGIIHTSSYALAKRLRGVSDRLIFHDSTDKNEKFQRFLDSSDGVFVSPSSIRGVDLKYDLCRWAIVLKCLYLDLGDYHTAQRLYASGQWGSVWYTSQAIDNIIQAAGRIVRNYDDWGKVYILDKQVGRLLEKNTKLWPMWFRSAIIYE